jgi:ATP-dependent RNA helicase RhlB
MLFDELDLPEAVRAGVRDANFVNPTPIQEKTLPLALKGQDVAGQAQTGTGKTAAFLIAIFTRLLKHPSREPGVPRALVLAPTRELALQIFRDAEMLGKHTGLSMTVLFGGMDYQKQRESLETGADIVIATPGRLMDYHRQRILILSNIEMVVVDEADRMFDMGFIKDIRYILRKLPSWEKRQSMLFSATLSLDVMELAYEHMNAPVEVAVAAERITAVGVEQKLMHVEKSRKFAALLGLMQRDNPERVIIFANTKGAVEMVSHRLNANGYKADVLSGDIPQKKRLRIVTDFKEGKLQVLVATDVASRGLHVNGVTHVINYDLPQDCEDYVHRIGRTARAGATGKAFALVDEDSAWNLEAIQNYIGNKIEIAWADELPHVEEKKAPREKREFVERRDHRGGGGGRGGRNGPPQRGRGGKPQHGRGGDSKRPHSSSGHGPHGNDTKGPSDSQKSPAQSQPGPLLAKPKSGE